MAVNGSIEITPESPAYVLGKGLRETTKRMRSIISSWTEQLSLNAPEPTQSYPIKKEQADNWVNSHRCARHREIARKFIDETQHITHGEFLQELQNSVSEFNDWLEHQPNQEYVVIVTAKEREKSDRWVAELALKHDYLKVPPKDILVWPDTHAHEEVEEFQTDLRKHQTSHLVVFDDGAYSGMQMWGRLSYLRSLIEKSKINMRVTLNAIIPFIRERGSLLPSNPIISMISKVSNFLPEWMKRNSFFQLPPEVEINLFNSRQFSIFSLSAENLRKIGCAASDNGIGKVVAYFDHKIADIISVCSQFYVQGLVRDDEACEEEALISQSEIDQKEAHRQRVLKTTETKFIDTIEPPYKSIRNRKMSMESSQKMEKRLR